MFHTFRVAFFSGKEITKKPLTYLFDKKQNPVGEVHQNVTLTFTDARYAEVLKAGAPMTLQIPVSAPAEWVKVVAYDYLTDLTGSKNVKLPKTP